MISATERLATAIETRWRKTDYSCYTFAEIAQSEMLKTDFIALFSFELINQFLESDSIKRIQIASEFSELHLKIFDNGKFYIEILNWWDKDTAIHDHGFVGVLLQLRGSALNVIYDFSQQTAISHNLALGTLKLSTAYISQPGDYHIIPPGRAEKHAVFHLEKPTVSMIVRTHPISELSPQLNYFPPYLQVNHSATDVAFNKKIKYFKMLAKIDNQQCRNELIGELTRSSLTEQFWLLMKLADFIFQPENISLLNQYLPACTERAPLSIQQKLVISATLRRFSQFIIDHMKSLFDDRECRLFLSCLAASYNTQERAILLRQFGFNQPDRQLQQIMQQLPPHLADYLRIILKNQSVGSGSNE
jgi:hypothetical protein